MRCSDAISGLLKDLSHPRLFCIQGKPLIMPPTFQKKKTMREVGLEPTRLTPYAPQT